MTNILTALFIDDNSDFRHGVVETLNDYFNDSLHIYQAPDCTHASNLLKDQLFDLVLLDIRVCGENGLDLIPLIRTFSSHSTIIVLSNFDLPEYEDHVLNAGADAYIAKCSDCFLTLSDYITNLMMEKSDSNNSRLH